MPTSSGAVLFLSLAVAPCATYDDGRQSAAMRLIQEVNTAGDSAVISVGMADVLSEGEAVADFIKTHHEYAEEFGHFAEHCLDLARRVLGMIWYSFIHGLDSHSRDELGRAGLGLGLGISVV